MDDTGNRGACGRKTAWAEGHGAIAKPMGEETLNSFCYVNVLLIPNQLEKNALEVQIAEEREALTENYRIQFKILMITFKAIHGMAPSYLSNLICIRSSSRYSLHNNDTIFLERPKGVMRTTLGARSFHASASALWNSLPAHIRTIDSLPLFKKSLKTYLFKLAF